MDKLLENCKGCLGRARNCFFIGQAETFKCPCCICIVKVICNSICKEFEDFIGQYNEEIRTGKVKLYGKFHN